MELHLSAPLAVPYEGQPGTRNKACPLCRSANRKCLRNSPNEHCRYCRTTVMSESTPEYNPQRDMEEWLKDPYIFSGPKEGRVEPSSRIETSINFSGPLNAENPHLVLQFDTAIYNAFPFKLKSPHGHSPHIKKASLTGAYLHLLLSPGDIRLRAAGANSAVHSGNDDPISLRVFYLSRIRNLIEEVMIALPYDSGHNRIFSYAGESILLMVVVHFRISLKTGSLSKQGLGDLAKHLITWLSRLRSDLRKRLARGCGECPNWLSVIDGPVSKLLEQYEYLSVSISLQQQEDGNQIVPSKPIEELDDVDTIGSNTFPIPSQLPLPPQVVPEFIQHDELARPVATDTIVFPDAFGGQDPNPYFLGQCSGSLETQNTYEEFDFLTTVYKPTRNYDPLLSMANGSYFDDIYTADKTGTQQHTALSPVQSMTESGTSNPFENDSFDIELSNLDGLDDFANTLA